MKHLGQHISKGLNTAQKARTLYLRLRAGAITACVVGWIASVGLGVWLVRDVLFPVAEDIAGSNQP